jgi:DMSO/TMAO reductase YedYZ molybdopterin-dependent catalytic subunit
MALEQVEDTSDFHCVTTWSKMDMRWRGVRLSTLLALAEPHEDATHAMLYGSDGYTTNVPLSELLKPDVLLVHEYEGAPLAREHGGPARVITPQLYAWKGAKWLCGVELMTEDRPGFWEQRGYSNSAHPWRNDRYS